MTTLAECLPALRDAVESHQAGTVPTIGGTILVDVQTANAILTVRDALSESARAIYDDMEIARAGLTAWKLLSRRTG